MRRRCSAAHHSWLCQIATVQCHGSVYNQSSIKASTDHVELHDEALFDWFGAKLKGVDAVSPHIPKQRQIPLWECTAVLSDSGVEAWVVARQLRHQAVPQGKRCADQLRMRAQPAIRRTTVYCQSRACSS